MYVMFPQHQNLSRWNEDKQRMWVEAKEHVEFMCEIHAEQARCHKWLLHEHLAEATSWNLEAARQILVRGGVEAVIADQCMYGWRGHAHTEKNEAREKWS